MMAKIGMKINAEIALKRFQGYPWGTQNRLKIAPGSLPGTLAPKKLPGTIRSVLDMPRDRPGIVPAAFRERPESPQGRPGTQ